MGRRFIQYIRFLVYALLAVSSNARAFDARINRSVPTILPSSTFTAVPYTATSASANESKSPHQINSDQVNLRGPSAAQPSSGQSGLLIPLSFIGLLVLLLLVRNEKTKIAKAIALKEIESMQTSVDAKQGEVDTDDKVGTATGKAWVAGSTKAAADLPDPTILEGTHELLELSMGKDTWFVFGSSLPGSDHIKRTPPTPCQDSHLIAKEIDFIVAIVCDGVGSHKYADVGSSVFTRSLHAATVKGVNESKQRGIELNDAAKWREVAKWIFFEAYTNYKTAVELLAAKQPDISTSNAGCTAILMVVFHEMLLCAHVGDGRAGYTIDGASWLPVMTPWKGEYANSSVFVHESRIYQTHFEDPSNPSEPFLETRVVTSSVKGFCLLSDGVENGIWQTIVYDSATNTNLNLNAPLSVAINQIQALLKVALDNQTKDNNSIVLNAHNRAARHKAQDVLIEVLLEGNDNLKTETDDKTLILGFVNN